MPLTNEVLLLLIWARRVVSCQFFPRSYSSLKFYCESPKSSLFCVSDVTKKRRLLSHLPSLLVITDLQSHQIVRKSILYFLSDRLLNMSRQTLSLLHLSHLAPKRLNFVMDPPNQSRWRWCGDSPWSFGFGELFVFCVPPFVDVIEVFSLSENFWLCLELVKS